MIQREAGLFRIVAIATVLLGISSSGLAEVDTASIATLVYVKADDRNVTSIAKNQLYPLKAEMKRDPCATARCFNI
jgi:hypothetical protein